MPIIVKFNLYSLNELFYTIWTKVYGLVNSICVKKFIFPYVICDHIKEKCQFPNKWGTTLSQEVIITRKDLLIESQQNTT